VAELSRLLGGRVLCCEDGIDALVENYLVGAMDVDEAMKYFKKTPNKVVITGAHRSDIQLAALETSTRSIILTGGLQPNDVIIGKAKLKGVPIVSVRHDTFTVVDRIEQFYGRAGIGHPEKIKLISELTRKQIDLKGILKGLGLK
jgi:BioD-like phosphotransacetylase family protein